MVVVPEKTETKPDASPRTAEGPWDLLRGNIMFSSYQKKDDALHPILKQHLRDHESIVGGEHCRA